MNHVTPIRIEVTQPLSPIQAELATHHEPTGRPLSDSLCASMKKPLLTHDPPLLRPRDSQMIPEVLEPKFEFGKLCLVFVAVIFIGKLVPDV